MVKLCRPVFPAFRLYFSFGFNGLFGANPVFGVDNRFRPLLPELGSTVARIRAAKTGCDTDELMEAVAFGLSRMGEGRFDLKCRGVVSWSLSLAGEKVAPPLVFGTKIGEALADIAD